MKEFEIQLDGEGWSGSFKMKLLPYQERLKKMQEFSAKDGDVNNMQKLISDLKENLVSIKVERDGEVFESLEDLEFYEDGAKVINELATVALKGVPVKKILSLKFKERAEQL